MLPLILPVLDLNKDYSNPHIIFPIKQLLVIRSCGPDMGLAHEKMTLLFEPSSVFRRPCQTGRISNKLCLHIT